MIKKLLSLTFVLTILSVNSQENTSFCNQLDALNQTILQRHISPKKINDSLSKHVHQLFIKAIDEDKNYLTQKDIDSFNEDALNIDDFIKDKNCNFINKYIESLQQRLANTTNILNSLYDEKLNYQGKDTVYFSKKEDYKYFKNENNVKHYWNKRIRYKVIQKLIEEDSVYQNIKSNFKKLEAVAKEKIIQKELCKIKELNDDLKNHIQEAFLNALAKYQDPNSTFFSGTDKFLFESSVSTDQESVGVYTSKNKDGDILITHIATGSPAFKEGTLKTNDILKSLSSNKASIETLCISNYEIQAFINNPAHKVINFEVKKENGAIVNVKLKKEKTKNEENAVTGFILNKSKKIGYINIKSFYTDLESSRGLGVANDVAKEIYKLQKENIEGIIIDLRFNGGGAMKEATDLVGMFINRGPVSILGFKNNETFTVKDMNRGSVTTKPLVIMVNSYSASASEYFASAMQDYNRAIIVGTPTHGKSSAQTIIPLNMDESKKLGYAKLTIEKFYQVTGQSIQSKGVIPDIILPSIYSGLKLEEKHKKHAFTNDSITVKLKHFPLKTINVSELKSKSEERVNSNASFNAINELNTLILERYFGNKRYEIPVTLKDIRNYIESYTKAWDTLNDLIFEVDLKTEIFNTQATSEILEYNQEDKDTNAILMDTISNDIHINETLNILIDYINQNNIN